MTYNQKLRDARWQRMRLRVFERDKWKCQAPNCQSSENTMLHVHHTRYLANRDPWEYELTDLISYCEKCHDRVHVAMGAHRLVEGHFYAWAELPQLLGFTPYSYLTEDRDG